VTDFDRYGAWIPGQLRQYRVLERLNYIGAAVILLAALWVGLGDQRPVGGLLLMVLAVLQAWNGGQVRRSRDDLMELQRRMENGEWP